MLANQIPIFLRPSPAAVVTGATLIQTTGKKAVVASTNASDTFAFPGSVTAGNTVILCITAFEGSGTAPVSISLGGTAATKDTTIQNSSSLNYTLSIWRATNVTGGTANCTVTWDFNLSGSYFTCSAEEWGGFLALPVDQVPTPVETGPATSAVSITSGTTSQAKEVVYTAMSVSQSDGAGLSGPTSGFTQTVSDQGATNIPIVAGYKIVAATGTQTANGAVTSAAKFDAVMVTYKTN